MDKIPDAPWIRDAERYGADLAPEVRCPCCGDKCDLIYTDRDGDAVGCDVCLMMWDVQEWANAHRRDF